MIPVNHLCVVCLTTKATGLLWALRLTELMDHLGLIRDIPFTQASELSHLRFLQWLSVSVSVEARSCRTAGKAPTRPVNWSCAAPASRPSVCLYPLHSSHSGHPAVRRTCGPSDCLGCLSESSVPSKLCKGVLPLESTIQTPPLALCPAVWDRRVLW